MTVIPEQLKQHFGLKSWLKAERLHFNQHVIDLKSTGLVYRGRVIMQEGAR